VQHWTTDAIPSYTASDLRASSAYQFAVVAIDADNNHSDPRTVVFKTDPSLDIAIPQPPSSSSVNATPFSASRVDLVWGASPSPNVSGYQIFRDDLLVGEVFLPLRLCFSDNGLAALTSYSYTIRAVSSAGVVSPPTSGRTVTTLAADTVRIVRGPSLPCTTVHDREHHTCGLVDQDPLRQPGALWS
jgi:hypothetical protein